MNIDQWISRREWQIFQEFMAVVINAGLPITALETLKLWRQAKMAARIRSRFWV